MSKASNKKEIHTKMLESLRGLANDSTMKHGGKFPFAQMKAIKKNDKYQKKNNMESKFIYCSKCGHGFSHKVSKRVKYGGAAAGAAAGAKIGAGIGLAGGPLGAIAGTIPGAIIGGAAGLFTGTKIDNPRCPSCNKKFNL